MSKKIHSVILLIEGEIENISSFTRMNVAIKHFKRMILSSFKKVDAKTLNKLAKNQYASNQQGTKKVVIASSPVLSE